MSNDTITIDIDRLRDDLRNESYGAYFGGGYGGALMQAIDVERASDEKLVEIAVRAGLDLKKYQVD